MKLKFFTLLFIFIFILPAATNAVELKNGHPRLANYYLKWELNFEEARELAKWDVVILDMETQENSPESLKLIREINPKIIILAYITTQEIIDNINQAAGLTGAFLRRELRDKIDDSWWLKDVNGKKISFWPGTYMLNLSDGAGQNQSGQKFNDFLPEFIFNKIAKSGFYDGIFYDNTWGDVSWLNNGDIDIFNNGKKEPNHIIDQAWSSGFKKMLQKTRDLVGENFIIIGNGRVFYDYQNLLNGMMLESFPSYWENGGNWSGSMETYLNLSNFNLNPQISIINVNKKNQLDYQAVRFGLGSTLLGSGFFSFDYDVTNHTQTWWYDEYNINLGPALNRPYNLLEPNNSQIKPGLWRRDFKMGSVFVNSTNQEQLYILNKESLEKISGSQDKQINDGSRINFIKLKPEDGIILLKNVENIINSPFINGYFYRIFNTKGEQVKNGFFSFNSAYPANAPVIITDGTRNNNDEISLLSSEQGNLSLRRNDKELANFHPYNNLFRKTVNFATHLNDGFIEYIVTGPTTGGGPQVRLFKGDGRLLSSFFAYNEKNRGGVQVAIGDVDGDGILEIITAPGKGEPPLIKVFTLSGELKNSFFAYDEKFTGGVELVVGDLNKNGSAEIITAPGPGGGPQIRVFNSTGRPLAQFFAYDVNYRAGLKLSLSDITCDGYLEIMAGVRNFY